MDNGASSYRRFLMGDETAFDLLIKEYLPPLVFFVCRYVHNETVAEDIAMDVFADLIAYPKRYHFGVSLKTYLFMQGRSRALNYLKRSKTVQFEPLPPEQADTNPTLEQQLLHSDLQKTVHCALSQLSEEMQIAVHLVYFEQLSYEDAARIMKKNKKQIDNLLYRAKKSLRTLLKEEVEL